MPSIYDQHRTAFASISAFVVLKGGVRVATVAIKFPRDGAERLYAYVHWIGGNMVRGCAAGCRYNKETEAVTIAARALTDPENDNDWTAFRNALLLDNGYNWTRNLRYAGFMVLQAV